MIKNELQNIKKPDGYYFDFGNIVEQLKESQTGGMTAIIMAIFMVFAILCIQFNSFITPLKIIPVIPICAAFSVVLLATFSMSLNLSVFIGIVILSGVVVNNSILIADGIGNSMSLLKIYKVVKSRIKPVFITNLTTILAMLPLIIKKGEGQELWRPLALTLSVGLIAGTFVNLAVFPLLFIKRNNKA